MSERPRSQNTQAFLVPLLSSKQILAELGVEVRCFYGIEPRIFDCDVIAINSKIWPGSFKDKRDQILSLLDEFSTRIRTVLYFDRSSTPAHVIPDLFPYVTKYLKTSLLRDRTAYLNPLYGGRAFADFYHRKFGIKDDVCWRFEPLTKNDDLTKLGLSWNTAFGNYSLLGPRLTSLYGYMPMSALLRYPINYRSPASNRSLNISCRMGLNYLHESVAYQRRKLAQVLEGHQRTDRVSKLAYIRELTRSKIVTSPFGYSEINYKDFETFISGALLLKPDMSHLETYPDLYRDGETYVAHDWALSDVNEKIDMLLENDTQRIEIARGGQNLYRWHASTEEGRRALIERFVGVLRF